MNFIFGEKQKRKKKNSKATPRRPEVTALSRSFESLTPASEKQATRYGIDLMQS